MFSLLGEGKEGEGGGKGGEGEGRRESSGLIGWIVL